MARDVAPAALRLALATGERAQAGISSAATGLGRSLAAGADALVAESCAPRDARGDPGGLFALLGAVKLRLGDFGSNPATLHTDPGVPLDVPAPSR